MSLGRLDRSAARVPGGSGSHSSCCSTRFGGLFVGVAAAALITALAGEVRAQATPPEPATKDVVVQFDPVTVTARKRQENEQDVPISMTVLKGARLDISPIGSNAGLARSVPNLNFVDIGGQAPNFANIRGVGSFSPVSSDDTSVVFYVDEVPQSVYGVAPVLMDIDRIEVLRGPQGTLFGRNTQAGAVSIIPRRPVFDREFALTGEIGTDRYGFSQLVANATIVPDKMAGRLAFRWANAGGDIPNIVAGGKDGAQQIYAARGTLLFTPGDRTEALLAFNYAHDRNSSPRFLLRDATDFPVSATDPRTKIVGTTFGFTLRVQHRFKSLALTSLTSVQRNRSTQLFDPTDGLVFSAMTGLPSSFFNVPYSDVVDLTIGETSYLQELRLSSLPESKVAWTVGVSFYRTETSTDRDGHAVTPAFLSLNGIQANDFTTNSYAAFGEVVVPLFDRLKATVGLRATHEDKRASYRFDGDGLPGVVPSFADDLSLSDTFLTGRVVLSYQWTPAIMTYASVARGHVASGFPAIAVNSAAGQPEEPFPASKSWTYELGFKSTFFAKRLTLNGAFFFNDVRDGHLVVFDPTQALFTTAALDYTSYGGEIEATVRPAPNLVLFVGIGYTHATLRNVPADSLTGAETGNDVPNVPALTMNFGAEYRWVARPIGLPGTFVGRVTYQYVGARAADVANSFRLDAYNILGAKLTWQHRHLSLYAFVENLLDERYQAWGQSFGTIPTVRVGRGRIVGVGARVEF